MRYFFKKLLFFVGIILVAFYFYPLYSITPHTITIDGDLSEWQEDEIVYDDSQNDSVWGSLNEIHRLYATWDANNLYLGVSGVQKDGNNLIVYVDTSPIDGVSDASILKDPSDSNSMWWWRRGNKFGEGFKADFQWQMYEMRLNIQDGHGLFRLYPDGRTANLNSYVEQKSSGGGAGVLSSAEIKIPWQVLYGDSVFPEGEELRIIACVTGGMDTRGTSDSSDDLFGSARDTIPDQSNGFPSVWYDTYTLTNYLTLKFTSPSGRSPIPRGIKIYQTGIGSVKIEWRARGVVEKNLSRYKVYYSSSGIDPIVSGSYESTIATYTYITGLIPLATYQFCLRPVYNSSSGAEWEGGASDTVASFLAVPDFKHIPITTFCFPGRKIPFFLSSSRPILSSVLKYVYKGQTSYNSAVMDVAGSSASISLSIPVASKYENDIFYFFEITDAYGTYLLPPLAQSLSRENLYSTHIAEHSSNFVFPSSSTIAADFGGGVKIEIPPYAVLSGTTIYFEYSSPLQGENTDTIYDDGKLEALAYYDFYTFNEDGQKKGFVFEKPVRVSLRYFDEDIGNVSPDSLVAGRLSVGQNVARISNIKLNTEDKTISFDSGHFSKFALFKTLSADTSTANVVLKKIIRPIFNPSLSEVVEFDFFVPTISAKIEIFDLKSRLIRTIEGSNFWDGKDNAGDIVMPGVYLWRITAPGFFEKIYGSCVVIR